MFLEFQNQVYTVSDVGKVVITDNTDFHIDGLSKKIVFTNGLNEYVDIAFDSIDLSQYEELSFHINHDAKLEDTDLFKFTIDGTDFNFKRLQKGWNHILINSDTMGVVTTLRITSLITDIVIFFDYIGVRKVEYSAMDLDLLKAIKNHISLDYSVSTILSEDATVGNEFVRLSSYDYVYDTSTLEINSIETVELLKKDGTLKEPLINNHVSGVAVKVICPTELEDYSDVEADPICGIALTDLTTTKDNISVTTKDGEKLKQFLGETGITIYIDCSSKKKVLQLTREYNKKYGERFSFLLDGGFVEMYMESESFVDNEIGNNPRKAYFYRMQPQPVTIYKRKEIDTINLTIEPKKAQ